MVRTKIKPEVNAALLMDVMNIPLVLNQHLFGFVQLIAYFTFLPDPMSVGHVFSVAVVLLELF